MIKTTVREELVSRAKHIQGCVDNYRAASAYFEQALDCLRDNQAQCRALGIEDGEICASMLEELLYETKERSRCLGAELERLSIAYMEAMKNCGLLVATDPNFTIIDRIDGD